MFPGFGSARWAVVHYVRGRRGGLCTRVSLVPALGQRAGFEITSDKSLVDELMVICALRRSDGRPRPGWLGASLRFNEGAGREV